MNAHVLNYWKINQYLNRKKACLNWGHRKCFYFCSLNTDFFLFHKKRIYRTWYSNWQLRIAFPQVSVKKGGMGVPSQIHAPVWVCATHSRYVLWKQNILHRRILSGSAISVSPCSQCQSSVHISATAVTTPADRWCNTKCARWCHWKSVGRLQQCYYSQKEFRFWQV